MEVKNVKIVNKLPIICSFDFTFIKYGYTTRELRVMETNGKRWIAYPSRQYESDGKKKYFAYVGIDQARKEAFEKKLLELIDPFLKQADSPPFVSQIDNDCPF